MNRKLPTVSCGSALDNSTADADPLEILAGIKSGKWRRPVERIRAEYAKALTEGRDPKKAVDRMKKALPGVIWSGRYSKRNKDCLLQHSGLLCGDIDHLDGQVDEVRGKLLSSPYVLAVFRSPTNTGLKVIFRIPPDPEAHLQSWHAANAHVHALTGADLDPQRKDTNGLCFLSYDPDIEVNLAAQELSPLEEAPEPPPAQEQPVSGELPVTITAASDPRHKVIEEVIGGVQWTSATRGICTCPGRHRHSTGDGERDCEILLDGDTWLHCFHASCAGIRKAVSAELRSRLCGSILQLPPITDAADFAALALPKPSEIIAGMLHRGSKLAIGGGSKSFKTWTLIDVGLSVSYEQPWLEFPTAQGRVLYINLELQEWSFQERIKAVAAAKGITLEPGRLDLWNLRGHAADHRSIVPAMMGRIGEGRYALVIFDPIYKILGDSEENATRDIAALMNSIERVAVTSGAGVGFGAHFSKGNQAGKESIDRISGSGVFARDPDSILTMTRHKEEDAFTVEATLRNFPQIPPFVVRWNYPLMERASDLDPQDLKQPKRGRSRQHTPEELLETLPGQGLKSGAWQKKAEKDEGIKGTTFHELRRELKKAGKIQKDPQTFKWIPLKKQ